MMRYYLLDNDPAPRFRPVDDVCYTPCAENGWAISVGVPREYCADYEWAHISDVDEGTVTIPSDREMADKLYTLSSYHVVSEAMRSVFDSLSCDDSLDYLPVVVFNELSEVRARYWMVYPAQSYDPLDYDNCQFEYWKDSPEDIMRIVKWAFSPDRLPDQDLFHVDVGSSLSWVCTERLRESIEIYGLTGCVFKEIWSS